VLSIVNLSIVDQNIAADRQNTILSSARACFKHDREKMRIIKTPQLSYNCSTIAVRGLKTLSK
jgi:hypothetical protein